MGKKINYGGDWESPLRLEQRFVPVDFLGRGLLVDFQILLDDIRQIRLGLVENRRVGVLRIMMQINLSLIELVKPTLHPSENLVDRRIIRQTQLTLRIILTRVIANPVLETFRIPADQIYFLLHFFNVPIKISHGPSKKNIKNT
jgi:hypothetical protein